MNMLNLKHSNIFFNIFSWFTDEPFKHFNRKLKGKHALWLSLFVAFLKNKQWASAFMLWTLRQASYFSLGLHTKQTGNLLLFLFPVCFYLWTEARCTWGSDIISWALHCTHRTTDHKAVTTNAEQMFISCWNGMNSSCTVAGFIGALAALRRHCSLFACYGIKSQDNKVNGHDLNSMPASTAGEVGL